MKTNAEIEHFISLQRTGYGDAPIARCYLKDILKDYESIEEYLPEVSKNCLDIGCGIGGIDLMLYRHYAGKTNLYLLDYSKTSEEIYYGFRDRGAIYNSLDLTGKFLQMNGVDENNIAICDVNKSNQEYLFSLKFDVIISLLSCGFHYPVSAYLDFIKKCSSGIVILDIRKGAGQREILEANFSLVKTIADWRKCERLLIQ